MYQIASGSGSVNYRQENEAQDINSKIAEFQAVHGVCASFKELFERALEVANGRQKTIETVEVYPENALYIGESLGEFHDFSEKLIDYRKRSVLSDNISTKELIEHAFYTSLNSKIEPAPPRSAPEIPENAIVVEITDEPTRPAVRKLEILQLISTNRQRKYNSASPENIGVIIEKLVFSEGALYNHGGDVHTGL